MEQQGTGVAQLPLETLDTRRVASELAEMLAVLVVPAMFLSGLNLFFG